MTRKLISESTSVRFPCDKVHSLHDGYVNTYGTLSQVNLKSIRKLEKTLRLSITQLSVGVDTKLQNNWKNMKRGLNMMPLLNFMTVPENMMNHFQ